MLKMNEKERPFQSLTINPPLWLVYSTFQGHHTKIISTIVLEMLEWTSRSAHERELRPQKGWINGKALKGYFFFIHFNLKFIPGRFLNKRRAVCRWDLHSNSVGPWVDCRFIGRRCHFYIQLFQVQIFS